MRRRKVLIIHNSSTIRKVIRRYLLSELTDIDLIEADSAATGNEKFHEMEFDVILCGKEITDMDGLELHERMRSSEVNRRAAFVLITSDSRLDSLQAIRDQGVEHVLVIPFSARALAEKVHMLCNPRRWRKYDRVCMLGLEATFRLDSGDVKAEVVNVSCGGVLCDLRATERVYDLLKNPEICLHIPKEYGGGDIRTETQFVRLSVLEWKTPHLPARYRTAWSFRLLTDRTEDHLQQVIINAQSDMELGSAEGGL